MMKFGPCPRQMLDDFVEDLEAPEALAASPARPGESQATTIIIINITTAIITTIIITIIIVIIIIITTIIITTVLLLLLLLILLLLLLLLDPGERARRDTYYIMS